MGILDRLRPGKPAVPADAPTLYRADIATDGGNVHSFSYLVESETEITIVYNERQFVMPKGATFVVTDTGRTEWDGQPIHVKSIAPVRPEEVADESTYSPPEALQGESIPPVNVDEAQ
ncbi:hypothetical protein [Halapricum desulfuricans]|uniref:Uncharacterized protein n=1 Tax=Halapricum desulfuricans TaxID=2841257 RepID=A0A897MUV5_9EURY|nr:hypothetical protein [Halapricum desulfuricans]QSG05920.1 hypothetical protein HSR121_1582 [Halapricum desulfuricans]